MEQRHKGCQWTKFLLLAALSLVHSGCYYMQAASGQWQVMRKSEPIDEVIGKDGTSDELAARLRLIQEARHFSVEELGLPDNESYRNYTDIERDFVVWNVFAAPEFSLQPKKWCFPIAGCVSYRGYFSHEAALSKAERLTEDGYDVAVGGVSAYSTLGNFNDPVLSSMLRWDDIQLVGTLFHELAHQVLYVKGDTGFNESFATAVEEFGLQRWLESRGQSDEIERYWQRRELRGELMALVAAARDDLQGTFAMPIDEDKMRQLKTKRLLRLREDLVSKLEQAGRPASTWLSEDLNNARLASMTLYEGWLPAFRSMFQQCREELPCFYAESKEISRLGLEAREARLMALSRR
ncbi:MAG: aminopeptidase [Woeseiaceae bacterium]